MTARRYVVVLLSSGLGLMAAVASLNALVDPYAIFGAPRFAHINEDKPYAGDRARTGKIHQVLRVRPRTLIVGNSRPEMGLDPLHPCWPQRARPVYNLAVPGLTVYRQARFAQHAMADDDVRAVYMGVDFPDFLESGPRHDPAAWPPPAERTLRLKVGPGGHPRPDFPIERLIDRLRSSFSLEALIHSLATVAAQGDTWVETRTGLGFNPAERLYEPIVRSEGTAVLFAQKNAELAARLAPPLTLYFEGSAHSVEFEALERLAAEARSRQIELRFFINPYHAEYLLMIDAAGYWPMFEEWKSRLVRLAARHDVPLWDFALFDTHATELVDVLAPRGEALRWFWEPAHYRRELGDLILANLLRDSCPASTVERFGVRLDERSLGSVLNAVRARRDRFVDAHPEVRARIERQLGLASGRDRSPGQAGGSGTDTRISSASPSDSTR